MTRIAAVRGAVSLLACLLAGGCVGNVAVEPEAGHLSWTNTGCPGRQRVNAIAIDSDGRIVLGVYDYEREDASSVGAVYVSSDNGETWAASRPATTEIEHVAVDSEGRIFAASWDNICRSTDHGESWSKLPFRHFAIRVVAIDGSDNIYLPMYDGGLYFSDDHGDSWSQIGSEVPGTGEVRALAVNSKGCIFVVAGNALYMSLDRGATWTEPPDVPWDDLVSCLAIDGEDRIVVSSWSSFYRSIDDGDTWTAFEAPDNCVSDRFSFGPDGLLYFRCARTLYASSDAGDSWNMRARRNTYMSEFASNEAGDVFMLDDGGLARSMHGVESVEMLGFHESAFSAVAVASNGYCYVAPSCGGVYRSSGALERWERFNHGLEDITLYSLTIVGDSLLAAGTSYGVYVSPLDEAKWSPLALESSRVKKIFGLGGDSILVFANTSLLVSIDRGASWSEIGMKGYEINAVLRDAGGALIAGTSFGGVFRHTGGGILWDQLNEGLGDLHVNALAVERGGALLAGTQTGLFISSNGGASWRRFADNRVFISSIQPEDAGAFFGSGSGVLWAAPGTVVLRSQNDGLLSYDLYSILSIVPDTDDRLLLLTDRRLLRSTPLSDLRIEAQ